MSSKITSIAAALVFLVFGSILTSAPASAQDLNEYLGRYGYVRVPMTKLSTGHETVLVTINGVQGQFVVDSGAGGTVVHSGSLAKFSLTTPQGEGVASSGAGGPITVFRQPIKSFEINGLVLDIDEVNTLDLSAVAGRLKVAAGVDIDGVLGQDVLTRFKGVLEVSTQSLFLHPAEPVTEQSPGL